MSNQERNIETKQDFKVLVPIEGYPGLYTYGDIELPDEEEMDRVLAESKRKVLIEQLAEKVEEMDLTEMKLVPLENYPGLFTYEPINSE